MALFVALGCNSKKDEAATAAPANNDYLNMNKGMAATEAAGTNSNGLALGSGLSVSVIPLSQVDALAAFNPETDCATSGWPAVGTSGDVGYAVKFMLCSVLRRPNGPDTVKGGFDRITGFLCAVGPVTYDNTARTVSMTFSTSCFSQNFVTNACT